MVPGVAQRCRTGYGGRLEYYTPSTFTKAELIRALESIGDDEEILVRAEPSPYIYGILAVQCNILRLGDKITTLEIARYEKAKEESDKDLEELAKAAREIVESKDAEKHRGRPRKEG